MSVEVSGGDLAEALRTAEVFQDLPDAIRQDLAADMSLVLLEGGETVVRQGESTDTMFVVIAGELAITCLDRHGRHARCRRCGPGRLLAEASLLVPTPAPVTACAAGRVVLGALSRQGFDRFAERNPPGMVALLEALRPALRRHRLWMALNTSDAFRHLDVPALVELETALELVPLYSGEVVMREGEPGGDMFVVVSGRLRVATTGPNGAEVILAELGAGETVGEMAFISGEPRSATVYAIRDSQLARLSTARFEQLLEQHPKGTFQMVTSRLVARLRNRSSPTRRPVSISTVAVVGAAPGVPVPAFAARLAGSLAQLGRVGHLTSALGGSRPRPARYRARVRSRGLEHAAGRVAGRAGGRPSLRRLRERCGVDAVDRTHHPSGRSRRGGGRCGRGSAAGRD